MNTYCNMLNLKTFKIIIKCFVFIFSVSVIFFLYACDNNDNNAVNDSHDSEKKYPAQVLQEVNALANAYFKDPSSPAKKSWIDIQLKSFDAINSIVPDIPIQTFDSIKSNAVEKNKGDWKAAHKQIIAQTDAFKRIALISNSMKPDAADFAKQVASSIYPHDYIAQAAELRNWGRLYNAIVSNVNLFSQSEIESIKQRVLSEISKLGYPASVNWLAAQSTAKRRILQFLDSADESVRDNLKELEHSYPADFEKQLSAIENIAATANGDMQAQSSRDGKQTQASRNSQKKQNSDNLASRDDKIKELNKYRFSIFTNRGIDGKMSTAVLVKLNGQKVVLCTKDFFDGSLPYTIANSLGKIKCSRAFISSDYPLVMLMPDSVPDAFVPFEVVSPQEMVSIIDKKLTMIAPSKAGFSKFPVRIFSEDQKYLNLTSDTAPEIRKSTNLKRLDRKGEKFLVSTKISVDAGNNSIVIDPDSGKLVSMAFRKYNPGVLSWTGKTGSIVGNENMAIPDINNFIRQFDGVTKSIESPDSSIQFIRMTGLENWMRLDPSVAAEQKTQLRRFTDDNNDFLMFFKRNLYGDMLRSRRLGQIAERYRKPFLSERMDRISYERNYKKYMLDVMYAMRRELSQFQNANSFYPIYRDEMEYQIALRRAMHDYLAEVIKNGDITNVLHVDLRARYSDPMVIPEGQLAPTTFGGSKGGGF